MADSHAGITVFQLAISRAGNANPRRHIALPVPAGQSAVTQAFPEFPEYVFCVLGHVSHSMLNMVDIIPLLGI
ncbi:hypothetical protein [Thiolapillus sp.]|uniref:hypothetical protein n=1 Tax=Thiolapillus sp. TaxID=2017437 RepID=UPI003AF5ACC2